MQALNATPQGGSPKEGFDLTHFQTFSSKLGQFLVCDVIDTIPDSDYKIAVDAYTRTMPNNTANFAQMKENYYLLHVPYGIVSRNAYQMLVDREEKYSAIPMDISQFPTFRLFNVVSRCIQVGMQSDEWLNQPLHAKWKDIHGFNIACGAIKLFSMLGYGDYTDILMAARSGVIDIDGVKGILENDLIGFHDMRPTATRLCAYQASWYHFFRNSVYDLDVSPRCFNLDDVTSSDTMDILSVRDVDDFIIECCQLRYVGYKKDIYTASMPGTQYGAVSTVDLKGDTIIDGVLNGFATSGSDMNRWHVQSGSSFEDLPNTDYDVHTWHTANQEYRSLGITLSDGQHPILHDHDNSFYDTPVSITTQAGGSLFDVLSLVESQAIQKWRQKSMLAGNRTVDQWRAHYGVVPRHLIEHRPDFIGSVDNEIQIQAVISQADTAPQDGTSNLGAMAGRGFGASDNRVFNFHSNDFGCLLVIRSVVPENTYSSFGLDRANQKVYYTDFYHSEFQNIGLEAVPVMNLDALSNNTSLDPDGQSPDADDAAEPFAVRNGTIGFAPRNYDLKQVVSKTHGLFNPQRLVISRVNAPVDSLDNPEWYPDPWEAWKHQDAPFGFADFNSFVMARPDMHSMIEVRYENLNIHDYPENPNWSYYGTVYHGFYLNLSRLYVNPSLANSLFSFEAGDADDTDQFITHARIMIKSVAPMTTLGLPQF